MDVITYPRWDSSSIIFEKMEVYVNDPGTHRFSTVVANMPALLDTALLAWFQLIQAIN